MIFDPSAGFPGWVGELQVKDDGVRGVGPIKKKKKKGEERKKKDHNMSAPHNISSSS